MILEKLVDEFESAKLTRLSKYRSLISSKNSSGVFPPYIPRVGGKYDKHKVLVYGMAQNIYEPWEDLLKKDRKQKVRQLHDAKGYKNVWIAPYKVMLALAGIYLYAKSQEELGRFSEIDKHIAATNYYKFSLNDGNDLNPDKGLPSKMDATDYWAFNDELADKELQVLSPKTILSFRGRHNEAIGNRAHEFHVINDPSWILQGAGGCLKKNGSWDRNVKDAVALKLVNEYVNQIGDQYSGKKEAVKIYLLKYYQDWAA